MGVPVLKFWFNDVEILRNIDFSEDPDSTPLINMEEERFYSLPILDAEYPIDYLVYSDVRGLVEFAVREDTIVTWFLTN